MMSNPCRSPVVICRGVVVLTLPPVLQVPNPEKFPTGFKSVCDYIHGLGLKSGLYTAMGNKTCAGYAASCGHEAQDAALWASWGIECVLSVRLNTCIWPCYPRVYRCFAVFVETLRAFPPQLCEG